VWFCGVFFVLGGGGVGWGGGGWGGGGGGGGKFFSPSPERDLGGPALKHDDLIEDT